MAFYVGQKVVCVDAGGFLGLEWGSPTAVLSEGAIYTVREIGQTYTRGELGLRLFERNLDGHMAGVPFNDHFYMASRFRPVVERKTDISIFTEMLTPNKRQHAMT